MLVYDQLQKVYKFIDKYMDAINENSIKELKNLIGALDNTFLEKRHAKDTVKFILNNFEKREKEKVKNHVAKLKRQCAVYANDFPLNKGDNAYVIRNEHGWINGEIRVKIIERFQNSQGVWSYIGLQYEDRCDRLTDIKMKIDHTRDLSVCLM